jgi:hypothetical protein
VADQPRSLAMGITATDMLTCAAAHDAHAQQAPKRQQKRRSVQQSVSKVSVVPPACRGWPGGGVVSTVHSAPNTEQLWWWQVLARQTCLYVSKWCVV